MEPPQHANDLRQWAFFQKLPKSDLEHLFKLLTPRRLEARASLSLARHFARQVGFVWSGRFRAVSVSPAGRAVTLFAIEPGEPFGYAAPLAGGRYGPAARITADEPGTLLIGDAAALVRLISTSHTLSRAFLHAAGQRLLDYAARIYELATADIRTRVCAELLRLSAKGVWSGDICTLQPAPTQATLATQICVTREVISRQLNALKRDGLIELKRQQIVLKDLAQIEAIVRSGGLIFIAGPDGQNED